MTLRVTFRPEAERELVETFAWYEERRQGLGTEFAQAIVKLIARMTEHPAIFPRIHGEVRRATLRRFPYAVYFRLAADEIVVLAIHGRRNPRQWQSRARSSLADLAPDDRDAPLILLPLLTIGDVPIPVDRHRAPCPWIVFGLDGLGSNLSPTDSRATVRRHS